MIGVDVLHSLLLLAAYQYTPARLPCILLRILNIEPGWVWFLTRGPQLNYRRAIRVAGDPFGLRLDLQFPMLRVCC